MRNPVRIPEKVLAWRERQRKGSIMEPKTFRGIKRKAARVGYDIPSAVGGKAYWITVLNKYLDKHPGDKTAMRTLRQLLKGRKRSSTLKRILGERRNPGGLFEIPLSELKELIRGERKKGWYTDIIGRRVRDPNRSIYMAELRARKRGKRRIGPIRNPSGKKWYVGHTSLDFYSIGTPFQSVRTPTKETHGSKFVFVVGPFKKFFDVKKYQEDIKRRGPYGRGAMRRAYSLK